MSDDNTPDHNAGDDWDKALAEQQGQPAGDDDPWAAALAEQEQAGQSESSSANAFILVVGL